MENESSFKIDKLQNATQWSIWKFQIRVILNSSDLMKVVDGTSLKPEPEANNYAAVLETWKKNDSKAQRIIVTSMGQQAMIHIMNCATAREMWTKLETIYEHKTQTSVHLLQQKFYSFNKSPQDDMAMHISKLEKIVQELKDLNEKVSDTMVITKILMTLPSEYGHFFSAWESTPKENRTLDNLTSRLMMEESRMSSHASSQESEALIARKGHKTFKPKKDQQRLPGKCYGCGKTGHWKRDCKDKKAQPATSDDRKGSAFISESLIANRQAGSGDWFLDSGASDHMTRNRDWFSDYAECEPAISVKIGNGEYIYALGKGTVKIKAFNNSEWIEKTLTEVLYVPEIHVNLFSVSKALDKGLTLHTDKSKCKFLCDETIVAVGVRQNQLYKMQFHVMCNKSVANSAGKCESLQLWHERLGHQNVVQVKSFLKNMNIDYKNDDSFKCSACIYGKQHRSSFKSSENRATSVGALVHADLCGPMQVESIGGAKYFLLLKDDFSRYRSVYFLKAKSEVCLFLERFIKTVPRETTGCVKILRTDNGLEFVNKKVEILLNSNNINHQRTVPYTPEQNGRAEREMRTIVEAARTMIHAADLNLSLWAEAVNTAVFVINRSGPSGLEGTTPFELWFQKKPIADLFRVFGAVVFTHIPKEKRRKWDKKSKRGVFVGYSDNTKGYRIFYPSENKVELSRDVVFDELKKCSKVADSAVNSESESVDIDVIEENQEVENVDAVFPENCTENVSQKETDKTLTENDASDLSSSTIQVSDESFESTSGDTEDVYENQRSLRDRNKIGRPDYRDRDSRGLIEGERERSVSPPPLPPKNRPHMLMVEAYAYVAELDEPSSFHEAKNCKDALHWKEAMMEEMNSLRKNSTWSLVEPQENRKTIDNRWVFKIKTLTNGDLERYKARLVVRGFTQQAGLDYHETFSPVVKFASLRMLLATIAAEGLLTKQFDIKTAFLYGDLEEQIFMKQPEGFDDGTGRVCLLKRSLYGLKQASRCWNSKFTSFLKYFGLKESKADPCVFIGNKDGNKIYLAIYIDDGLVAASRESDINQLIAQLRTVFCTKVGDLQCFLGLEIMRGKLGSLHVCQAAYAEKVLRRFNMIDACPVGTPTDTSQGLDQTSGNSQTIVFPYREAVGSLMYLSVATRPDISYAVGVVSRHLDNPNQAHVNAVKRILKYIVGTMDHGIFFDNKIFHNLECFSDADYAGDRETRRSTSGYVFMLGSGAISWSSQRQTCVALSTTESEYIAAAHACKELIWLERLMDDLQDDCHVIPNLHMDNQSAIRLVKNPEFHKRTKHIDIKFHFIRDCYLKKKFALDYINTELQVADIFTKPLAAQKFIKFKTLMGMLSRESM